MSTPNSSSVRTKYCPDCQTDVAAVLFSPHRQHLDGLDTYCRPCRNARERRASYLRKTGRSPWVPADRARAHVQQLLDQGMSRAQVAKHAGLHQTIVRNLMVGQPHANQPPASRLRKDTEARLLDVAAGPCDPAAVPALGSRRAGAQVDSTGTIRRLRALMANGWPAGQLALLLGCKQKQLQIRAGRRCSSSTALAVRQLYERLAETPGPSTSTATFYRHRGYLHPGWWDEDTIDDPTAVPDGVLEQHYTRGRRPVTLDHSAPWEEQAAVLARMGLSRPEIARRLGCSPQTVKRALGAAA